jgi:hypothetical protein
MTQTHAKRSPLAGCLILALILTGGVIAAVAALTSRPAQPPTPYQQCVTSLRAEPAGQVLGFTPACLKLPLSERNKAIRQVTG